MPPLLADTGHDIFTARTLIPGAYEPNTLTHRQPGAMGGSPYGVDGIPDGSSTLAAVTIAERQKEGGGGVSQRPARPTHPRRQSS